MDLIGHSITRVFGEFRTIRQWVESNPARDSLRQEGFSMEEAENISYLYTQRKRGQYLGLAVGGLVGYTMTPWINIMGRTFPAIIYNKSLQLSIRLAAGYGTYLWMTWLFTFRREGPNNALLNMFQWTNLKYARMRDNFCQNFQVLNRPFTAEEVQQFSENQANRASDVQRRFIYNPYFHGSDELEFRKQMVEKFVQNIPPWERKDVQLQIALQNEDKIKAGEVVRVKPFNVLDHFDKTGILYGLKRNMFLHNYQIVG